MENDIVVDLRLINDQKSTKAYGSVTIPTRFGDITILKLRVIHQDQKEAWVALPQISYPDKQTGETRHADVLDLGVRLKLAVADAVLAKYRELTESDAPF